MALKTNQLDVMEMLMFVFQFEWNLQPIFVISNIYLSKKKKKKCGLKEKYFITSIISEFLFMLA